MSPADLRKLSLRAIVGRSHAEGQCLECAICGKAFSHARKPRSFGLHDEPARTLGVGVIYLLCGPCTRLPSDMQRRALISAARPVLEQCALVSQAPAGSA